jgi:hypothetical protein
MSIIKETHKHDDFSEHGLVYHINQSGKHVVTHYKPAGEDIAPDVYRYDNIDDARATWKMLRVVLAQRGYKRVSN